MTSKNERDEKIFWRDLNRLQYVLLVDLDKCLHRAKTKRSQLARRNLVRSAFAAIEGLTWTLKLAAVRVHQRGKVSYTPGELAILSEVAYDLDDNGSVKQRAVRLA